MYLLLCDNQYIPINQPGECCQVLWLVRCHHASLSSSSASVAAYLSSPKVTRGPSYLTIYFEQPFINTSQILIHQPKIQLL